MNKDAILNAVEKYSQSESILGTFSKVIGTDPGSQTTSVLMAFSKVDAATAEEAYALYLLDNANTDRSLYYTSDKSGETLVKPRIVIGDETSVGERTSWQDVEYVQTHLASEGVHIPYGTVDSGKIAQNDILQAFSIGDATAMTVVVEIATTYIVMDWVTQA